MKRRERNQQIQHRRILDAEETKWNKNKAREIIAKIGERKVKRHHKKCASIVIAWALSNGGLDCVSSIELWQTQRRLGPNHKPCTICAETRHQ